MRLKTVIVILVSILTLIHCKKGAVPQPQILQEEKRIDEHKTVNVRFSLKANIETDILAYPKLAVSHLQNKIILYGHSTANEKEGIMVARTFDKKLKLIGEKTFPQGQGPGDVGSANMISIGKDKIFISENSNKRVSIYANDWTYITSLKHRLALDRFEIYDNGTTFIEKEQIEVENNRMAFSFVLGSIPGFETKYLFTTSPFLPQVKSGNRRKLVLGGNTEQEFFYKNKEAFILECSKYRILKFDSTGKKLRDVIVKVDEIKTDHTREDYFLEQLGFAGYKNRWTLNDSVNPTAAMIPLGKGFVVIRRHEFFTPCNEWVDGDYFSYQLEYLGKIKVPCVSQLLFYRYGRTNKRVQYDDGFLYSIQEKEENTILEKWEVTE